jgi:hypothetical protein
LQTGLPLYEWYAFRGQVKLAGRSGQRAAQDIGESHALPQSPWHALVHGAGMGFGICAVLALGYLAWYFEL